MVTFGGSRGGERAAVRRAWSGRGAMAAALACVLLVLSGCRGVSFRLYEYEEDVYLSLDGSATVYVSGSTAALDALRGFDLSTDPVTPVDLARVRALYTSPEAQVTQVTASLRGGRRYVHVRLDVPDIRQLSRAAPFSWARYEFHRAGPEYAYREQLGASADKPVGDVGWTGQEMVAFRLHLPSVITFHNAGPDHLLRGNVLLWEQRLTDRLAGVPLDMQARMQTQSILYRTLILFALMGALVVLMFVALIWWVVRRPRPPAKTA
ncbi:MAG: hypothetical protein KGN76_07585 [Acidobacteriota bacterium]|nr:hypothetical protein [Acidobacteriota bacterium]